ncbi:hypothetical protein LJK87_23155 [Paenibacillus sp. P25]|nr:hypothetical protein LJK87_23155 [Paenibacillus sp. P25]
MSQPLSIIEMLTTERRSGTIIWMCNIGAEQYWHPQEKRIVDREERRVVGRIEEMNLLCCAASRMC